MVAKDCGWSTGPLHEGKECIWAERDSVSGISAWSMVLDDTHPCCCITLMNRTGLNRRRIWGALVWCLAIGFVSDTALAELSLQTSLNVEEMYTDNLFYRDTEKEEDFGTYVGPNATLRFENPDIVLGATYFGRFIFFVNHPSRNRYVQNANILLDLPFLTKRYQGLSVTVDESMNFTPQLDAFSFSQAEDSSSLAGANPTLGGGGTVSGVGSSSAGSGGAFGGLGGTQGIFTRRASAFNNNAGLTVGYEWTPQLTTTLAYANQYRHFFSSGFQDSMTHMGTISLPYRMTQGTTVTPMYSYRQTEFLGQSTQATLADRMIFHNMTLGLTQDLTPSVSMSVNGGVSFMKQEGATEQVPGPGNTTVERVIGHKFVGRFIGGATLSKTYRQGTVSLTARQNTGSGGGLASQGTWTRTITGRILHDFSTRLSGFGSLGYAQNNSVGGNAFKATTYRGQVGLRYSFLRWLYGAVSYSHIDQRSKGTVATDLVVKQVFLSLSAVADPWYLLR